MRLFLLATILVFAGCEGCQTGVDCRDDADACGDAEECFVNGDTSGCAVRCNVVEVCGQGEACLLVDDLEGEAAGACFPLTDERLVGTECEDDLQCASGICEGADSEKTCRGPCDLDDDQCPEGTRCFLVGFRSMCLVPRDQRPAGEGCDNPMDCASGICIAAPHLAPQGEEDYAVCSDMCVDGTCTEGSDCLPLTAGINVCLAGVPEGEVCNSHDECAGGRCITDSDPNVNDTEARCRFLCDSDDKCLQDGRACLPLEDGGLSVCMPVYPDAGASYPDDVTSCEGARECQSGFCGTFTTSGVGLPTERFCAVECDAAAEVACPEDSICWPYGEEPLEGLCGPIP